MPIHERLSAVPVRAAAAAIAGLRPDGYGPYRAPDGLRSCGSRLRRSVHPVPKAGQDSSPDTSSILPGAIRNRPVTEDLGKAFLFSLSANKARAGHDHCAHPVLDLFALHEFRPAARRSSIRPLVHEPIKTVSISTSLSFLTQLPVPCIRLNGGPLRLCRPSKVFRVWNRTPVIGRTSSGRGAPGDNRLRCLRHAG